MTSVSPNVEGMTAISAWMIVCILFVFAALAGYAYLVSNLLSRDLQTTITEIGKKAWLFAKLQPCRGRKRINAT